MPILQNLHLVLSRTSPRLLSAAKSHGDSPDDSDDISLLCSAVRREEQDTLKGSISEGDLRGRQGGCSSAFLVPALITLSDLFGSLASGNEQMPLHHCDVNYIGLPRDHCDGLLSPLCLVKSACRVGACS